MCKPKEPSSNFRNNLGANKASSVDLCAQLPSALPNPDPFRPRHPLR